LSYLQQYVKKEGNQLPRKGYIAKRDVLPDPIHKNQTVTKFINQIMLDGKKGTAEAICYSAFNMIQEKSGKDPVEVFGTALKNVMPVLEVKARRVGGANYQVPIEVRAERRTTLGLRWLVSMARKRGEKTMQEKIAGELLDASNNTGGSVKKKDDMHKMAEANKAFAHYKW